MPRTTHPPLPALQRLLRDLGENIRLARLRRKLAAALIAQRAGLDPKTLRRVERGDPSATLGAYANVLHTLGLEKDLALIAKDDLLGRKLQDAGLQVKQRAPKRRKRTDQDSRISGSDPK